MPRFATLRASQFQSALRTWYQAGHRAMPWRNTQDAYTIWLAEVMLQQTQVATVIPYHQRFLEHFPTVHHLAQANIEQVLHLWQGLGYYRRAHLLHRCAQQVVHKHGGVFPNTEAALRELPGIGPYTAAVIAATAFNQPAVVVDGNVERVIARLYTVQQPLPAAKPRIRKLAAQLALPKNGTTQVTPRLYANAIMELGATVCTPHQPACHRCPVHSMCGALHKGMAQQLPYKKAKSQPPHYHGTCYLITTPEGGIYLHQRSNQGLLAGLWELPHTGWETPSTPLPFPLPSTQNAGQVTHTFTHFKLTLQVQHTTVKTLPTDNTFTLNTLPPLSTLMHKALKAGWAHISARGH